ncbi:MAG TPA: hypothetical protein VEH80_12545 [Candidatus Bathyarchaeia archaeon]|nr:hypothetical protein [Candidatus Bathyarchaeia archaeon]
MARSTRRLGFALAGLLSLVPLSAGAVEYRLNVASLWDSALPAYLSTAELYDGASGPGLARLEENLDQGEVPPGVMLSDRPLRWASESVAHAYGTVRVLAEIRHAGEGALRWDEVRWEGKPGERSVWVIAPGGRARAHSLYRAALKGDGPMRQFMAYIPVNGNRSPAVKYGLSFLWFYEERGGLWERYLSRSLDLHDGLGAVVGENSNRTFPDQVYLVVQQGAQPTTYKAVLVWRESEYNFQAPSNSPVIMPR